MRLEAPIVTGILTVGILLAVPFAIFIRRQNQKLDVELKSLREMNKHQNSKSWR